MDFFAGTFASLLTVSGGPLSTLGDAFSTGGHSPRFLTGGSSSWMNREAPPPFCFPLLRFTLADGPAPPPLLLEHTDLRDRFLFSVRGRQSIELSLSLSTSMSWCFPCPQILSSASWLVTRSTLSAQESAFVFGPSCGVHGVRTPPPEGREDSQLCTSSSCGTAWSK
uniref:Uncharacterized protein n=1 Tax=Ixodes ricinus TaxID=34613 RepID=A0A6B0UZJ2_IXORI